MQYFSELQSSDAFINALMLCCAGGLIFGILYKVPAIILLSGAIVLATLVLAVLGGWGFTDVLTIAIALCLASQFGYLLGVAASWAAASLRSATSQRRGSKPQREQH